MRHTAAGIGIAGFLLAQLFDATTVAALPALALGGLAATFRDELDFTRGVDAVEWALGGVVLAFAASAWLGSDFAASAALSVPLVAFVLVVVMLRRSVRFEGDRALALAGLAVLAASVLLQTAIAVARGDARAAGPWIVVPNDVCWVAAAMPWFVQRFGARRIVAVSIVAATIALAWMAQSRLALLVAAVALVMAFAHSRRARVIAASLAVSLTVVGVALLAKGTASFGARAELALAAFRLGLDAPLFGIGPHRFAAHYLDVVDARSLTDPRLTPWPHSLPLELWAETGAVGLMAVLALIYCTGRSGRPSSWGDGETATRGVLGGFTVAALFEASTLRVWTWVIAAIVIAIVARVPHPRATEHARYGE